MDHLESGPVMDLVIDREVRQALDVVPSPEFLARVRTRISNEPPASPFPLVRLVAVVGLLIAAIATGSVVFDWRRTEQSALTRARSEEPGRTDIVLNVSPPASPAIVATDAAGSRPSTSQPRATPLELPAAVFSQDDMLAFRRLLVNVAEHRLELPAEDTPSMVETSTVITIPPIKIEPLSINEGVVQ
jgi:hypothetical protein